MGDGSDREMALVKDEVCKFKIFFKAPFTLPLLPPPRPLLILWLSVGDHSAMAPPRGGGEASLKEQKEAGLEQGDGDSSWHDVGLMASLAPGGGDWQKESRGRHPPTPLTSPIAGVEGVAMEPVTMGRRVGRLRKKEGRREWGTVGHPGPPRSM